MECAGGGALIVHGEVLVRAAARAAEDAVRSFDRASSSSPKSNSTAFDVRLRFVLEAVGVADADRRADGRVADPGLAVGVGRTQLLTLSPLLPQKHSRE